MDMLVQAYSANTDIVEKPTISSPTANKKFKELLRFAKEAINEDDDDLGEDMDALLMQLLSLLNIPIDFRNIDVDTSYVKDPETELASILEEPMAMDNAVLPELLQELLTEFEDTGSIELPHTDKFYDILKTQFPEMEEMDVDTLKTSLEELFDKQPDYTVKGKVANTGQGTGVTTFNSTVQRPAREDEQSPEIENTKQNPKTKTEYDKDTQEPIKQKMYFVSDDSITQQQRTREVSISYDVPTRVNDVSVQAVDLTEPSAISEQPEPIDKTVVFDQIVDKIELALGSKNQQISIRLKPDHLGQVLVKVFADKDDRLRAEFFVENTQVKEMLSIHAPDFKNQIQEHGCNFSDISVYDLSDSLNNGSFNQQFQGENNHNQFKRSRYLFKGDKGSIGEISTEDYVDPWKHMSSVDFRA